ncbi:MAG: asparagine synthase (glutamine-hydrolyzing) [Candidatus Acidiferrum sp.]
MCGIVGILARHGNTPDSGVLSTMMDAMRHRGPDDSGSFYDGEVALGFRRLSIIDLCGGHQPLSTSCGRYTIVFNGEIYNYRELREELVRDYGALFLTASDTEVVVNALKHWGTDSLSRFNGMFAFAVWDAQERSLFLARDRIGKKPLFYSVSQRGIVFASEVKSLLEHPDVPRALDASRLPIFLAYRYLPGDETLFAGVHCLPAATWTRVSAADVRITPRAYWDFSFRNTAPDPAVPRELETLLDDAVHRRMIADVPLGLFLSGGLDSSVILALMVRHSSAPVKTFSVAFDTGFSEAKFAREVATLFHADHTEVRFGAEDLLENLGTALWARESPVTEPSDIPIMLLARTARKAVTVVLSGEGSDEIFGGYLKYGAEAAIDRWSSVMPRGALGAAARLMPYRMRGLQLALECASEPDPMERYAAWFGGFRASERQRLLRPDLARVPVHAFSRAVLEHKVFPGIIEQMLYLDLKHWLPANLLLRADRMTMANGLELRCPFLDYRLVEFAALRVAGADKVAFNDGKLVLKGLARKWLPDSIINRRKWGFKVPIAEWLRGDLLPLLRQRLLAPGSPLSDLLDAAAIARLIDEHAAGRKNHEKQLWILLQLELWHAMFVERSLRPDELRADIAMGGE